MRFYFLLFFLFPFYLVASIPLTFDDLVNIKFESTQNNREVEVRGFLYPTQEGQYVLASEPNLKTCCIGTGKKTTPQLKLIEGKDLPTTTRAVTVKGTFSYLLQDGRPVYLLTNPIVVEEEFYSLGAILILMTGVGIVAYLLKRSKDKRQ